MLIIAGTCPCSSTSSAQAPATRIAPRYPIRARPPARAASRSIACGQFTFSHCASEPCRPYDASVGAGLGCSQNPRKILRRHSVPELQSTRFNGRDVSTRRSLSSCRRERQLRTVVSGVHVDRSDTRATASRRHRPKKCPHSTATVRTHPWVPVARPAEELLSPWEVGRSRSTTSRSRIGFLTCYPTTSTTLVCTGSPRTGVASSSSSSTS